MKRQIITIDSEKCNGCELCVRACHEGAIGMKEGKAVLLRDDYCDGLGNCLPVCPTGAISFEQREAAPFDEEAVKNNANIHQSVSKNTQIQPSSPCACPGNTVKMFSSKKTKTSSNAVETKTSQSELRQWPVQIKLAPITAPFFQGAHLLIAADCAAYAYASFHNDYMKGRVTIIGCPKLDEGDYTEKLTAIIQNNDIQSVMIVRMQVPCCGGLSHAATEALKASGKYIPYQIVTISTDGEKIGL